MTLKSIGTTFFLGLFLAACNTAQKVTDTSNFDMHTSQISLDWQGSYSGILPCASCPGIETELTLTSDHDYILTRKYIDHDGTDTENGKFTWEGNRIKLSNIKAGEASPYYKVEEGRIRQLDLKGKEITGELAQNYVLTKNGNPNVEDKRWKIIELYGKPIEGNAQTHYIIFHSKDGKLEAKSGCNSIQNSYKIKNQYRLEITPGISTLMACPDNTERELLKALAEADNLTFSETNLSLNKARMAPLARFELVNEPDYAWIFGKTFIQEGSESNRPEYGGPAFLKFISENTADLKTGDIVSRMNVSFEGDKILLTDQAVSKKRTFTITDDQHLLDEKNGKWYLKNYDRN